MRQVVVLSLLCMSVLAGCADKPRADGVGETADFDEFEAEVTATTGIIRGLALDPAIRPVEGALVVLQGTDRSMTTTSDGLFLFDDLEPGTYFIQASKAGFNGTQTAAEVVAGVAEPPIVKILLTPNPGSIPLIEEFQFAAFITCGVAVIVSSVGCATVVLVANAIGDRVYFPMDFTMMPQWIQSELVWKTTQPAGGGAIWQIAGCDGYCDGRPAGQSPLLAFIEPDVMEEYADDILENGVQFNLFGGPHPSCAIAPYGCGLTVNQHFDAYVHNFYNFVPREGWRFYYDGPHPLPT